MVLNINNKKIWIAWNYCFLSSWPGTCLYLYLFDRLPVWYRYLFYLSDLQYYLSSTYSLSWPIICLVPVLECLVLVVPSWPFTCMVHVLPIWPGVCLVLVVPSWPGVCLVLVVPSWPGVCLVLVLLSWPGVCLVPLLTGTCCTFLTWCCCTFLTWCLSTTCCTFLTWCMFGTYLFYLPDLVSVYYRTVLVLPSGPGGCLVLVVPSCPGVCLVPALFVPS